jgi:hypothetical protein
VIGRTAAVGLAVLMAAAEADAQRLPPRPAPSVLPARVELAAGIRRSGPTAFGAAAADETDAGGGSSTLFETDTRLQPALALEGRLGLPVSSSLQIDVGIAWGRSDLQTRITSDSEGFDDVTAAEAVTQVAIEASLLAQLARYRMGASAVPFLLIGGGYLRELHEEQTLVETGRFAHVGGGVNIVVRTSRVGVKAMGIRGDARAVIRIGGVALDDDPIVAPAFGVSWFVRF